MMYLWILCWKSIYWYWWHWCNKWRETRGFWLSLEQIVGS